MTRIQHATAQLLAAAQFNAAAWRGLADATHVVAGERKTVTTLLRHGVDAVPGGRPGAEKLGLHVHAMATAMTRAEQATSSLTEQRNAFTKILDSDVPDGPAQLRSQLRELTESKTDLGKISRFARIDDTALLGSTTIGGVIGAIGGGGVFTGLAVSDTLAMAPALIGGVGTPLALALTGASIFRNGNARSHEPVSAIVHDLDATVSAAIVDGTTRRSILTSENVYRYFPVRRAVDRMKTIDQRAHQAADAAGEQSAAMTQIGDSLEALHTTAARNADYRSRLEAADQAAAAESETIRAQQIVDWTKALGA